MNDTARMIGTVGIWLSVTIILTFGVFRANWNSDGAVFAMVLCVALICGTASVATKAIWRSNSSTNSDVGPRT